jgi:hypothetical protein
MAATPTMRIVRRLCQILRTKRSIWMASGRMLRRRMKMRRMRICCRAVSLNSAPRVRRNKMTAVPHALLLVLPTLHPRPSPPHLLFQPRRPRELPPRHLLLLPREVVHATLCLLPLLLLPPQLPKSSVTLAIALLTGSGTLVLPM